MPKPLLDRCLPDSIMEFRASAGQRYNDGLAALAGERRTGAIYLWRYAAEMTLKAAYFSAIGFADDRQITFDDLREAMEFGKSSLVSWPRRGQLHSVRAWAETLVARRDSMLGTPYMHPGFGFQVASKGQRLDRYWNESLRYHKNVAYPHEVRRVREATEWLLVNSPLL